MISFGWYFSSRWTKGARAQVIWAIGASMMVLAGLVRLPARPSRRSASRWWWGTTCWTGSARGVRRLAPLWHVLHVPGRSASCR